MDNDNANAPFPVSDAPARFLVVILASLANGPILVSTMVVLSGDQFVDPSYEITYGLIAAAGFLGLLLALLVFAIVRSPTRRFAFVSLLSSLLLVFISFFLTLPALAV